MTGKRRTPLLAALLIADLTCFALGGLGYGETWSFAGAVGLIVFLVCFELL